MEKRSKYFNYIKIGIILFVIYISLGTLLIISNNYNRVNPDLFDSIDSLISLFRTFLILGCLSISSYLCYIGYLYYTSTFYVKFKLSIIEAFMYSFIDIAKVYDKVSKLDNVKNIIVDLKEKILIVETKNTNYCVNVFDKVGKIEGSIHNENWRIVSKPKKKFNRIQYQKQIKISNPFLVNKKYIEILSLKNNKKYENLVVLTSFQKIEEKNEAFLHIYDLLQVVGE